MGFMDTIKSKLSGNKAQTKKAIDTAADKIDDHAGAHADKVHKAADMAKDGVDKLSRS